MAPTLVPTLIITSHAQSPPLIPPPDLKYDIRTIPNPPKAIRSTHTGLSKRLRAHLLAEDRFVQKLERAEGEIRESMAASIRQVSGHGQDGQKDPQGQNAQNSSQEEEAEDVRTNSKDAPGLSSEDDEASQAIPIVLRVGCFCSRGHHRSVGFVEELARRKWPNEWDVQVVHRDVGKARGERTKARKASRASVISPEQDT